jgi:hypothetical protein
MSRNEAVLWLVMWAIVLLMLGGCGGKAPTPPPPPTLTKTAHITWTNDGAAAWPVCDKIPATYDCKYSYTVRDETLNENLATILLSTSVTLPNSMNVIVPGTSVGHVVSFSVNADVKTSTEFVPMSGPKAETVLQ